MHASAIHTDPMVFLATTKSMRMMTMSRIRCGGYGGMIFYAFSLVKTTGLLLYTFVFEFYMALLYNIQYVH